MNSIEKIINFNTEIVADTCDIDLIKLYNPSDVTTNPSLILSKCLDEKFKHLLNSNDLEQILVNFGILISKEISGYISTEVDPNYSYNCMETINIARKVIKLYEENGISKNRILIKIASTWEGIKAAEILEKEGIKCNMTLIFSLVQAVACAQANVTLISPFVGRITDWYKSKGHKINSIDDDYGVNSVKEIFGYFKKENYKTIIMAASFRNIDQVKALTGLDKLTISPKLLEDLINENDSNISYLNSPVCNKTFPIINLDIFNDEMSKNEMANFKLNEGINKFIIDTNKLKEIIAKIEPQNISN